MMSRFNTNEVELDEVITLNYRILFAHNKSFIIWYHLIKPFPISQKLLVFFQMGCLSLLI